MGAGQAEMAEHEAMSNLCIGIAALTVHCGGLALYELKSCLCRNTVAELPICKNRLNICL